MKKDHPQETNVDVFRIGSADLACFLGGPGKRIIELIFQRAELSKDSYLCGYHMVTMLDNTGTGQVSARTRPSGGRTLGRNRPLNRKM